MSLGQWQRIIDVDLTGVFLSCQAEGRAMLRHAGGAVVKIASMSGSIVNRGLLQVELQRGQDRVVHLTRSLAMEWAIGRSGSTRSVSATPRRR